MEKEIKEVFYNAQKRELLVIYSNKTTAKMTGEEALTKFKEML